jgi:DNA-binding GntR family transcriptional regulator
MSTMTSHHFEAYAPAPNATVTVADAIREAIIYGRIGAGERLREADLARELDVSRTPVREALLLLQAEGIVQSLPRRGAIVRAYDRDELSEIYEVRKALERLSARRAAARITDAEVAALRKHCERFRELCTDPDVPVRDLVKVNLEFHELVLEAAASPRLASMVRATVHLPFVYKTYTWRSPEQRLQSARDHEQLTDALARRDADDAEAIMGRHLEDARQAIPEGVALG